MLKKLSKTSTAGVFRWKIEVYFNPQKRIHTHVELTEVAAQKMYAELLEQRARFKTGLPSSGGGVVRKTLGDAAQRYEHELMVGGKNNVHVLSVIHSLRILRDVLGDEFPVDSISRQHIRDWRERRLTSARVYDKDGSTSKLPCARTVNKGLAHLSAFCEFCSGEQWMDANPVVKGLRVKEIKAELRIMSWSDFLKLVEVAWTLRPDFAMFLEVLGESGGRVNEIMTAKVGDVSLTRRSWTKVVKPGRTVTLEAGEWLLSAVHGRKATEPMCPTQSGEFFTYHIVKRLFTLMQRKAGLQKLTPHYVRHGRACWELLEGKGIYEVKTKLAHSTVVTTERYVRAVEMLRREEPAGVVHVSRVVGGPCVTVCKNPVLPHPNTDHHNPPQPRLKPR